MWSVVNMLGGVVLGWNIVSLAVGGQGKGLTDPRVVCAILGYLMSVVGTALS